MARIRTIKPEFFRHEELYELEIETGLPIRVSFSGLWTACDREGRFKWKPRELKLDCLPFDEVDFSRVLDALFTRGFIVKYVIDGREYGFVPSWKDHQVINNRETESVLPAPDESSIISTGCTRASRVDHASTTRHGNYQGEGKGREGNTRVELATPDGVSDDVWKAFLKVRKAKKAPMSELALAGIRKEVDAAGWTLENALSECVTRGWQSFKAEWVAPKGGQQTGSSGLLGAI